MKKTLLILLVILSTILLVFGLSIYAPLPVPYYQDFSVMYYTAVSLLHGIPIYDYPAQLAYIQPLTPPEFVFHPYPYPPWYALTTVFIGLLPLQAAARTWFLVNLGLLAVSVSLLTPGCKPFPRSLALLAAVLFIPAFGLLVVGQYTLPVLLGAALFIHAVRRGSSSLAATGLLLLTFKPHIGGLILLACMVWLLLERTHFSLHTLQKTVIGGLMLVFLGFLADPAWVTAYPQSLLRYRDLPGVDSCGICASLPVLLLRLGLGQSSTLPAAAAGLVLLLLGGGLITWSARGRLKDPLFLVSVSAVLTLLIDPYLLNYDYVLLLVPLSWLVLSVPWLTALVYAIPWMLLFTGRQGSSLLSLAGMVTFILILFSKEKSYLLRD